MKWTDLWKREEKDKERKRDEGKKAFFFGWRHSRSPFSPHPAQITGRECTMTDAFHLPLHMPFPRKICSAYQNRDTAVDSGRSESFGASG